MKKRKLLGQVLKVSDSIVAVDLQPQVAESQNLPDFANP
jgi:hypothetical protein